MGKVKSIRLNKRVERMFNVIKNYYCARNDKITDTEIISNGIERLYEEVSVDINSAFYSKVKSALEEQDKKALEVFDRIYENLEVPCIMNGDIMQDEFWGFFVVNEEGSAFYDVDSETGERTLVNKQFEKIYKIVYNSFSNKEKFEECMEILHSVFFELFGNEYGREN